MSQLVTAAAAMSAALSRRWLLLKVPLAGYLAWKLVLPVTWKILVLLFALIVCQLVGPCVVGEEVREWHLAFMIGAHAGVVAFTLWYAACAFGYLQSSGWKNRVLGTGMIVASPLLLVLVAVLMVFVFEFLEIPVERIWTYVDEWTPVQSWKVQR